MNQKKPSKTRYKIIAKTFDKRGRLISQATNRYDKTHPLQAKYAMIAGEPYRIYLHAEINAIIKAKSKEIHKIKVELYDSSGKPKLAKPCKVCHEFIKSHGIKFVEYTI